MVRTRKAWQTDGQTDRRTDGRTDGQTDGQTESSKPIVPIPVTGRGLINVSIYVTLSSKTLLMENQTVPSYNSFLYTCTCTCIYMDHRLFINCAESEKRVFCRCLHVTKSPGFDETPRITRGVWSEPGLFCSSIRKVFLSDVTYIIITCILETNNKNTRIRIF